jgi:hypothetical protein
MRAMRQPRVALQATFLSLFILIFTTPARAQIAVDSQLWLQAVATVNLSDDWRLHLEEQPRWDDDATQQFQVITRLAVGRRVTTRMSLWAGHAWVHKMRDGQTVLENRLWQQLLTTLPGAGGWAPTLRVRTEQRFQDGWDGTSHRVRVMGRGARALGAESPWSAVIWGESFFAFNDTDGGPPKGWDQHRLFGGVNHRFGPRANLDAGYLHVVARRRNASAVSTPGALLTLNLIF